MYNYTHIKWSVLVQKTDLRIKHDEEIILTTVKPSKIGRPFDSFGTDPHNKGLTNIYDVLEQLSPKSLQLFCMLGRSRDINTNEVVLVRKKLSRSELYALNKGYKQLEELNVIKRIRDETYLINPDYMIPKTKNLKVIQAKYNQDNTKDAMNTDEILKLSANP